MPSPPSHLNSPIGRAFLNQKTPRHPSLYLYYWDCLSIIWSLPSLKVFLLSHLHRIPRTVFFYLGPLCCGRFYSPHHTHSSDFRLGGIRDELGQSGAQSGLSSAPQSPGDARGGPPQTHSLVQEAYSPVQLRWPLLGAYGPTGPRTHGRLPTQRSAAATPATAVCTVFSP